MPPSMYPDVLQKLGTRDGVKLADLQGVDWTKGPGVEG